MLTERTKKALRGAVKSFQEAGMGHLLTEKGPAFFCSDETMMVFDTIVTGGSKKALSDDIRANRKEAEQYLAGLLGMC